MTGTETEGFEPEPGHEVPRAHPRPETPDTDAMTSLLPELPPKPVSLRDQATELFSETIRTRPGTDDADLAACLQSILDAIDLAVSLRLRSERAQLQPDKWRTP